MDTLNKEEEKTGEASVKETPTEENVGDGLTKNLNEGVADSRFKFLIPTLMGLFVIVVLVWFATQGTTPRGDSESSFLKEISQIYTGFDDPTYIKGRDRETLGLGTDEAVGKFFYAGDEKRTLYTLEPEEGCDEACLLDWEPYRADTKKSYSYELRVIDGQYAWKGKLLFLYKDDSGFGSYLGDGYNLGAFKIARP